MSTNREIKIPSVAKDVDTSVIPKPIMADASFRFITAYPWLRATGKLYQKLGFTNLCKGGEEFSNLLTELIESVIVKVNKDYKAIFFDFSNRRQFAHCHQIGDEKLTLVRAISSELHDNDFSKVVGKNSGYMWWEIGFTQSARIIGIFSKGDQAFYPIFVDWYHLIYPDKKYNQPDFGHYKYDPHRT